MSGSTKFMVSKMARPAVMESAGRIDVQRNIFFRIFGSQEQHLRDDQIGDVVVNGSAQENDVFLEQARIDIKRALAARGLLHNHGH